jgi:hypothetical protein
VGRRELSPDEPSTTRPIRDPKKMDSPLVPRTEHPMQHIPWRHGIQRHSTRPRRIQLDWRDDEGAATAEYAITIMAAVGFAGLLVVILRSEEVRNILTDLVRSALSIAG